MGDDGGKLIRISYTYIHTHKCNSLHREFYCQLSFHYFAFHKVEKNAIKPQIQKNPYRHGRKHPALWGFSWQLPGYSTLWLLPDRSVQFHSINHGIIIHSDCLCNTTKFEPHHVRTLVQSIPLICFTHIHTTSFSTEPTLK